MVNYRVLSRKVECSLYFVLFRWMKLSILSSSILLSYSVLGRNGAFVSQRRFPLLNNLSKSKSFYSRIVVSSRKEVLFPILH